MLGADVLVCADLDFEAAQKTASLCQSKRSDDPGLFKTVVQLVDVRDETSVDDLFTETVKTQGRIDVLVNTAGVCLTSSPPA